MTKTLYTANTTTLTSLAILKVDIDHGNREYMDYLVAFVTEALAKHRPEIVSAVIVSSLLTEEFGLRIPLKAVQLVLRRMVRGSKSLELRDGAYFLASTFPEPSMHERREGARHHIDKVINRLCAFSEAIGLNPRWAPEDATLATLSFLRQFTVDCLRTFVFNTALPSIPETGAKEHYVVGRFITDAYDTDRELFNSFIVLVKGQMYANALTCPDLESLSKKFSTLTIYLDTPIILNLLGLHGEEHETASKELVELVRELNGTVRVFSHTIEEVLGVIRFSIDHYNDFRASNRLLREIRNSNKPKSDLLLISGQIEDILRNLHIRVDGTPPYSERYQIDEEAFRDALRDEIQYLGNQAVDQDVNSVRSIYVRRQGRVPVRLEDAIAVFVTSNSSFAKTAYIQGRNHTSSREISPVITDFSLSNIAWLKAPLKMPSLPEREALAMCYAALEPSAALLEKYVRKMDMMRQSGAISEDDHAILRASSVAQIELMNLTRGDDDALSNQSISTILEKAKSSLVADITREHTIQLTHQEQKVSELATLLSEAKNAESSRREQLESYKLRIRTLSHKLALICVYGILVLISVALLVGGVYGAGLISLPTNSNGPLLLMAIRCCIIFAVFFGWYCILTGKSLQNLSTRLQGLLAGLVERILLGAPKNGSSTTTPSAPAGAEGDGSGSIDGSHTK